MNVVRSKTGAVAHSMIASVWLILNYRQLYQKLDGDYFDERKKQAKVNYLIRRLEQLTGDAITIEFQPAAV